MASTHLGKPHKILCPAKVNLLLQVTGVRDDGYHDIVSLIQPVSLYDDITLTPLTPINDAGIIVTTDNPDLPTGPDNLVYKAAELFFNEAGIEAGVSIDIVKRIPVAAGLGGGSSDAAGVLMGLNDIFDSPLGADDLLRLALQIGSDVPFFLLKTPAIASGRGEKLHPIELPAWGYVLVNPGFPVSAGWAYSNLSLTKTEENNMLNRLMEPLEKEGDVAHLLCNDLEEPVIRAHPEVAALKKLFVDTGPLGALMSGSGPTVFALYEGDNEASEVYNLLKDKVKSPATIFTARGL